MSGSPGQAARTCRDVLHRLAHVALGVGVALAALAAAGAWRLSEGPVDLSWITARLQERANASGGPLHVSIGSTALAWEGFRVGAGSPLDLQLSDVTLSGPGGEQHIVVPRAAVSLSLAALLFGRLQPRAIELDHPSLTLIRAPDGQIRVDLGEARASPKAGTSNPDESLPALLDVLAAPPTTDATMTRARFGQVQRVSIRDAALTMIDNRLGVTWRAPHADLNLERRPEGGVDGTFNMALAVGDANARLRGTLALSPGANETVLSAQLTPVNPAALAAELPALAGIAAFNAPVGVMAALRLGPGLELRQMHATLSAGSGTARINGGSVPVLNGTLAFSGTLADIAIDQARLAVRARSGGPVTTLTAGGTLHRAGQRISASLSLGLDQVDFADLPVLWPKGVGTGARNWITENIPTGMASRGNFRFGLAGNSNDLASITVTSASGTLQGTGLIVHWLRPVPPLDQGRAELRVIDPDTVDIAVASARQTLPRVRPTLTVRNGLVHITGLTKKDQIGAIRTDVAGPLGSLVALLSEPRLHLLSDHPMPLKNPQGNVTASLSVTLPLDKNVKMDDVAVRATAHVTSARLGGAIAGRDLSGATLDVTADNNALTLKGQGDLAGIATTLDVAMDFRAGPPTQVLQRISASARPTAAQLAAAGLDATDVVSGPTPVRAVLTERRNGEGRLQLNADLTPATLTVEPLAWKKPPNAKAAATAQVWLRNDRLMAINAITIDGDGVSVRANVQFSNGNATLARLDHIVLGRSDVAGTVRLPATPRKTPIAVDLAGSQLDLSARLAQHASQQRKPPAKSAPWPPWTLNARFGRVLMAKSQQIAPLTVQASSDGVILSHLNVAGRAAANAPFSLRIAPDRGVRRVTASATDAGALLRAADVTGNLERGRLSVSGTYDDARPGHPLSGTAELDQFRVHGQTLALGRLLKAMTLYGVVDVMRGPGLGFTRLVAPYRLTGGTLELMDARAFSPSLGLTTRGWIDFNGSQVDLQGTIVPAYFFNALLGNVPLVGRLFSPERGGGVFAASYRLRGKLTAPTVSVNPLTALTPGFLRGIFHNFKF